MKESYGTLSETINALASDGYTFDFNRHIVSGVKDSPNTPLSPENFEIDKVFRFEGQSNPDDESVLYAISSSKLKVKGVLVNGYGVSTDRAIDDFIKGLRVRNNS